MTVELHQAKLEDLLAIAAIYTKNWQHTYKDRLPAEFLQAMNVKGSEKKWHQFLATKGNTLLVAEMEGHVAGFVAVSKEPEMENTRYIDALHVSSAFQNRGIGSLLLRKVLADIRQEGKQATICILRGNDRARAVYTKLGAVHLKYFEDTLGGTTTQSEKLIWQ